MMVLYNGTGPQQDVDFQSTNTILIENMVNRILPNEYLDSIIVTNAISTADFSVFRSILMNTSNSSAVGIVCLDSTVVGNLPSNLSGFQESVLLTATDSRYTFNGFRDTNRSCILIQSSRTGGFTTTFTTADSSCVISNQNATINITSPRQFYVGSFTNFFLRQLPVGGTNFMAYNPVTFEVFNSGVPITSLAPMTPTTAGIAFGLTQSGTAVTSLGNQSLATYSGQVPSVAVSNTTVIGSSNLVDLSNAVTGMTRNFVGGSNLFSTTAPLTTINNNNILASGLTSGTCVSLSNNNLLNQQSGGLQDLFNRTAVSNINSLSSQSSSFSAGDKANIVVIGSSTNLNLNNQSIVIGTGSTNEFNGSTNQMLFTTGANPTDNLARNDLCAFIGSLPASPTDDNQVLFSHNTICTPNLLTGVPAGQNQEHLYFDTTNSQIRRADPTNTSLSRVARFTATTDVTGTATVDYTSLNLLTPPIVTVTVVNGSTSTSYTAQISSITTTSVAFLVYRSVNAAVAIPTAEPAPAGEVVHCLVAY